MLEALDIIGGARRKAYGPPERNFDRIAALWNGYMEASSVNDEHRWLNAIDVCHMLDLVKLARLIESPNHEDSMRDRFGYQGCYVDLVYGDEPTSIPVETIEATTNEGWVDWPADVEPPYVADEQRPSDDKLRAAFETQLGRRHA